MNGLDLRHKAFGPAKILGGIRLEIGAGERVALLGPSGIGKTTLLNILTGLDPDFDGTLSGRPRIGMVFQEPRLLSWRSALDNLTLVTGCAKETAVAAMAAMGLAGKEGSFPSQMSLGQQRRLSLARAFAVEPDLLVLDEPFTSLDPALVGEMLELTRFQAQSKDMAILLVTHSSAEADFLAETHYGLEGTPARLVRLRGATDQ
jgi:NitT/TauT family transport system ATP-binding protein